MPPYFGRIGIMTRTARTYCGLLVGVTVLLATTAAAVAETCTLKLKRRESKTATFDQKSYLYWTVQPQQFFVQMTADDNGKWQVVGSAGSADVFKRIVRKEPKYVSDHPYRGVLKLGTQEFAFALDAVPPPEANKPNGKAAEKTADKTTEKTANKSSSLIAAISGAIVEATGPSDSNSPATPSSVKDFAYNRLYIDFNHNGDLTDDKVIEITPNSRSAVIVNSPGITYKPFEFPQIDMAVSVDGTKVDHSFYVNGYAYASAKSCTVFISFSSAVCREGDITLEGKQHHLVLIDFNSNGRFDDKAKISEDVRLASGQVYAQLGDMLLVDPQPSRTAGESPYDPTTSDYRYFLSDIIQIDGRWYDLKVTPAGDQLTLTPSTAATGNVTNHNDSFGALIYNSDKGILKIRGTKDKPVSVPEGKWKLYSYSVTKDAKAADAKAEANPSADSLLANLAASLGGSKAPSVALPSRVVATATEKYNPVTVRNGETVEMPFGPPYTPTVTSTTIVAALPNGGSKEPVEQAYLSMTLIGVGGEAVTSLTVSGRQPPKPAFTIKDPDGKVVQQGDFEYG
jgi:hypothetical protein